MKKYIKFDVSYDMKGVGSGLRTIERTVMIPDFEETNKKLAYYLSEFIKVHAKDIGEIVDIKIRPSIHDCSYNITIFGVCNNKTTSNEIKVDVVENFGLLGEK